jgi:HEAT repeat protein
VLIQALRLGADQRVTIVVALGKIGKPVVPELIFLLMDSNGQRRYDALWALANLGPEARDAAPAIGRLLADTDPNVRAKALYALFRVWPEATILAPQFPSGPGK